MTSRAWTTARTRSAGVVKAVAARLTSADTLVGKHALYDLVKVNGEVMLASEVERYLAKAGADVESSPPARTRGMTSA